MTETRMAELVPEVAMAAKALAANRLDVAETHLRERLHVAPQDVAALHLLGELAARVNRLPDAEALFIEALGITPHFHTARYALAVVLHRQARSPEALDHAIILRAADPHNPLYRAMEAGIRAAIGDHAESLALYEGLFAENREGPRLLLSYGHGLKTVGRAVESAATYRRLLTSPHPQYVSLRGEVWWSLANLKTERLDAKDSAAMRAAIADRSTQEESRVHLHYALGKALEDAGVSDEAFVHYSAGAAIRRRRSRYKAEDTTKRVDDTIATFTQDFLQARAGQGAVARDPIFVLGLPRSGSTLIEQILASHPSVEGTMELVALPSIARHAGIEGPKANPAVIGRATPDDLRRLGEAYLARTRIYRKSDRPMFVDKLPHNWLLVGLIRLILPNAKIIDVRRSPMASCVSAFKQLFARGQSFSYDLEDLGRYYRDYVRLMAHFDAAAPGATYRVIYDDLIDRPEHEIRRLLDYLALPFDPACLKFYDTKRAIWTPSAEQVRQPLYREGLDQWRVFEPHLGPLRNALGSVVEEWR